jgi:hypothetical protein
MGSYSKNARRRSYKTFGTRPSPRFHASDWIEELEEGLILTCLNQAYHGHQIVIQFLFFLFRSINAHEPGVCQISKKTHLRGLLRGLYVSPLVYIVSS